MTSYKVPAATVDLVKLDGLPRLVTDELDPTVQHVLYLDGAVRSMLAADWPPPLPSEPTQQQIDAAIAARLAATQQAQTDAQALRQAVITVAQSAVGISLTALTAAQVRALLACLLWKAGGVTNAGIVKPLGEWL